MYFVNPLKTWLRASLPTVILFMPAMVSGYGERTEMNSPTEKTGQKALTVEMKSTSAYQQDQQEVIGTVRISQRATGVAITPVYAPQVSSKDFENRALVLHARRDNYTDEEDSAGGSGDAIACGVLDPG